MGFSDLFKPDWKHSDKKMRLKALVQLEHEASAEALNMVLKKLLLREQEEEVWLKALSLMHHLKPLEEVLEQVKKNKLPFTNERLEKITKKVEQLYYEKVMQEGEESLFSLSKLSDPEILLAIIKKHSNLKVRRRALEQLTDASKLRQLFSSQEEGDSFSIPLELAEEIIIKAKDEKELEALRAAVEKNYAEAPSRRRLLGEIELQRELLTSQEDLSRARLAEKKIKGVLNELAELCYYLTSLPEKKLLTISLESYEDKKTNLETQWSWVAHLSEVTLQEEFKEKSAELTQSLKKIANKQKLGQEWQAAVNKLQSIFHQMENLAIKKKVSTEVLLKTDWLEEEKKRLVLKQEWENTITPFLLEAEQKTFLAAIEEDGTLETLTSTFNRVQEDARAELATLQEHKEKERTRVAKLLAALKEENLKLKIWQKKLSSPFGVKAAGGQLQTYRGEFERYYNGALVRNEAFELEKKEFERRTNLIVQQIELEKAQLEENTKKRLVDFKLELNALEKQLAKLIGFRSAEEKAAFFDLKEVQEKKTEKFIQLRRFLLEAEGALNEENKNQWEEVQKQFERIKQQYQEKKQSFEEELALERSENFSKKEKLLKQLAERISALIEGFPAAEELAYQKVNAAGREAAVLLVLRAQEKWRELKEVEYPLRKELAEKFEKLSGPILRYYQDTLNELQERAVKQRRTKEKLLTELGVLQKTVAELEENKAKLSKKARLVKYSSVLEHFNAVLRQWKHTNSQSNWHFKLGKNLNYDFKKQLETFFEARKKLEGELNQFKEENAVKKLALCKTLEEIDEKKSWKELKPLLFDLMNQWKTIGPVTAGKNQQLWERFKEKFDYYFEKNNESKEDNLRQKQKLAKEAEEIVTSLSEARALCTKTPEEKKSYLEELDETYSHLMQLRRRWHQTGAVEAKHREKLNEEFYSAVDRFCKRHQEGLAELKEEKEKRHAAKKELLRQLEGLLEGFDLARPDRTKTEEIKKLFQEWKQVGESSSRSWHQTEKRYWQLKEHFYKQRRENYEALQTELEKNYQVKKQLLARLKLVVLEKEEWLKKQKKAQGDVSASELQLILQYNQRQAAQQKTLGLGNKREEIQEIKREWEATGRAPREKSKTLLDEYYGLLRQAASKGFLGMRKN